MIVAAAPSQSESPKDAMHAADISDMRSWCSIRPRLTKLMMFLATTRPMMPDTIPVLGGAAVMEVPLGVVCGTEIGPGGAKAIPAAKIFR